MIDGAAVQPQYATMVNYEFETPNATFGWDNTLGEFGQPFVQLVKDVHAGEEIFANYGPWFAYLRHGFTWRIFDDAVAKRGRKTLHVAATRIATSIGYQR